MYLKRLLSVKTMLHCLMPRPDVILQWQLTSASSHFPSAFKTVTLLFHITQLFSVWLYRRGVLEL